MREMQGTPRDPKEIEITRYYHLVQTDQVVDDYSSLVNCPTCGCMIDIDYYFSCGICKTVLVEKPGEHIPKADNWRDIIRSRLDDPNTSLLTLRVYIDEIITRSI